MAENERLKGNEYMKSREYQEAIDLYTKSIDIFSKDHTCFANRAQAYLQMKNYSKCI